MKIKQQLLRVVGLLRRRSFSARVVIMIEDSARGVSFGWGPEIADLANILASAVQADGVGHYAGTQHEPAGYRISFRGADARALQAALMPLLERTPMFPVVSVFAADAPLKKGGLKQVWP